MQDVTLRRFFELDPTAACRAGIDGAIRECNPAFARLFGLADPARVQDVRLTTLLRDAAAWQRAAGEAAEGKAPARFEVAGRSMDGRSLHLACDVAPIGDPEPPDTVLAWFSDATERRELERELTQQPTSPTGSRIVRSIGHDLGNMMMVIRGFAEVLVRELPEGGRGRGWVAQIRAAADRTAALGDELLAAARQPDPKVEPLAVGAFLETCLPAMRRLAGPGESVELREIGAELRLEANRIQLEAALLALVALARGGLPPEVGIVLEAAAAPAGALMLRLHGPDPAPAWEMRITPGAAGR